MIAELAHAVARTAAYHDQLGMLWSPEAQVSLTVHGLPHEQIHALGGDAVVFNDGQGPKIWSCVISTRVRTPAGWEVGYFGEAQPSTCETCRRLLAAESDAPEVTQLAGVDGSGL